MASVATYLPRTDFARQLEAEVEAYFRTTGQRQRDLPQMYLKTAVMLAWLGGSYTFLVFFASGLPAGILGAVSLGLAMAGVGFNVQHDGNHGAYSSRPWINKVMSLTLDLMGGTAYFWKFKHNIAHHTHTNVHLHDDDINLGMLGRLSPHQRWYRHHRLQPVYVWLLYALMAIEWQVSGEFRNLFGRTSIGRTRVPRLPASEKVIFWAGKVLFFGLAFAVPLWMHPIGSVLGGYLLAAVTLGLVLATVFQLAHCSEAAQFRSTTDQSPSVPRPWAEHQVETTVDFARNSRWLSWYLGGLNFQIEHHLFPRICHVHYPALAPLVEEICRQHGVRYFAYPTLRAAFASHVRWLARMARPPVVVEQPAELRAG
jgi:linoleoyl-CoA desaturase